MASDTKDSDIEELRVKLLPSPNDLQRLWAAVLPITAKWYNAGYRDGYAAARIQEGNDVY